jgi:hypothetical protein
MFHRPGHGRIHEDLAGQRRFAGVPEPEGHGGGLIPTGALTGHGHPVRRHVEAGGVGQGPSGHRFAVLEPGGIGMLRRQPVLDRDHDGARTVGELAGHVVHDPDAAHDESAAVKVHDQTGGLVVPLVDPDRYRVHLLVADLGDHDLPGRRQPERPASQFEDLGVELFERGGLHVILGQPRGHPRIQHALVLHRAH